MAGILSFEKWVLRDPDFMVRGGSNTAAAPHASDCGSCVVERPGTLRNNIHAVVLFNRPNKEGNPP